MIIILNGIRVLWYSWNSGISENNFGKKRLSESSVCPVHRTPPLDIWAFFFHNQLINQPAVLLPLNNYEKVIQIVLSPAESRYTIYCWECYQDSNKYISTTQTGIFDFLIVRHVLSSRYNDISIDISSSQQLIQSFSYSIIYVIMFDSLAEQQNNRGCPSSHASLNTSGLLALRRNGSKTEPFS